MLIDSHCHLSFKETGEYGNEAIEIINAARQHGVTALLDIVLDPLILPKALSFSKDQKEIFHAFGIHPNSANKPQYSNVSVEYLTDRLKSSEKIIAVGETGLDFHYSEETKTKQIEWLEAHLVAASKLDIPVIIHTRNSYTEILRLLKQFINTRCLNGVIHCFSENKNAAQEFLDLGFYISFSGIVTFKNAFDIKEAAKFVPIERLLIETDSPYLAPVPFRGKPNQPAYVKYVAEYIALLRDIEFVELANSTANNFKQLFKVS